MSQVKHSEQTVSVINVCQLPPSSPAWGVGQMFGVEWLCREIGCCWQALRGQGSLDLLEIPVSPLWWLTCPQSALRKEGRAAVLGSGEHAGAQSPAAARLGGQSMRRP